MSMDSLQCIRGTGTPVHRWMLPSLNTIFFFFLFNAALESWSQSTFDDDMDVDME